MSTTAPAHATAPPGTHWLGKGEVVDLEHIASRHRPDANTRFFRVRKQKVTNLRPIKFGSFIAGGENAEADQEGRTGQTNRLKPESEDMIQQVAVGLKNDFKLWIEHPTDHSRGQLPNETPVANDDVGFHRMQDSPYFEPNLEETEFWIVKDVADDPTFHAVRETGDTPIEPTISLRVNELILEPVTHSPLAQRLERFERSSTPVDLIVDVED